MIDGSGPALDVRVVSVQPLLRLPTRRNWGEAWWTARDICLTNQPELPEPLQAIADKASEEMARRFIFGDGPS